MNARYTLKRPAHHLSEDADIIEPSHDLAFSDSDPSSSRVVHHAKQLSNESPEDARLTAQTLNSDGTPKRPMNAFMIFARKRRPQVSAENQMMRTGEISKLLSKEWNTMEMTDKQYFLDQAKKLKDNFNAKYPDYVYRRRPNNSRKKRKPDPSLHPMLDGSPSADAGDEMSGFHEFDYPSPVEDDDSVNHSPRDLAFSRTGLLSSAAYEDSQGFPSSHHPHHPHHSSSYPSYSSSSDLHPHGQLSHSGGNRVIQLPSVHDRSGSEGSLSGSASQHSSSGDLTSHAGYSSQVPPSQIFGSASDQLGVHAYQWPIPSAPRGANPTRGAGTAWPPSMITPLNTGGGGGGGGGGRNDRSLPALSASKLDLYTPPPHSQLSRPWSTSTASQPSPTASSASSHLSSHSYSQHLPPPLPTLSAPFFPDGRTGSPPQYHSSGASSNSASPEAYFSTAAQLPLPLGSAYGRGGGGGGGAGSEYDTPSYGVHHSHPSSTGGSYQSQREHQQHHHSQLLPAGMLPSRTPHMIPVTGGRYPYV